ncbi:glycosyltransferase [Lactiplantibacillus fabifermentans]|nr:glycosyltransferase [Lactiplantibacillus fabifermentans]ETY73553.1 glycosyl transferase family 1 [Lactiplantibacillus fabifermentans T30PCM01]
MKVMLVVENLVMDGVKRATTVLGNALSTQAAVTFYALAQPPVFFKLQAPLIVAPRPADATINNFFGTRPLEKYAIQITDLIATLRNQKTDTVILPGGLLTSFAPAIKAALPNLNVIAWMHNNVNTYLNQYYVGMQTEFKLGLMAADTVVVLTDYDWEGYSRFNPHTVKIYNPLTLRPAEQPADLRQHTLAFTGRIDLQHKGVDYLVALARELPSDWRLAIAGSGKPHDMATFHRLVDELGVQDRIIYRGALQDVALQQHYRQASIFVMASRWEGMPLVIGEAMAMGLPVVSMWNTGSAEYLQDSQYGVLTPAQDIWGLWRGLWPLLAHIKQREYYAQQALLRSQDFTLARIVHQWWGLLTQQYLPQVIIQSTNDDADLIG